MALSFCVLIILCFISWALSTPPLRREKNPIAEPNAAATGSFRNIGNTCPTCGTSTNDYVMPLPMCSYGAMNSYTSNQGLKYNLPTEKWASIQVYTDWNDRYGVLKAALASDLNSKNAKSEIQYYFANIGYWIFSTLINVYQPGEYSYALKRNCIYKNPSDKNAMTNTLISFSSSGTTVRVTYTITVNVNAIATATRGTMATPQAIQDFVNFRYYGVPSKMLEATGVAAAFIKPQFSKFVTAMYNPQTKPAVVASGCVGRAGSY